MPHLQSVAILGGGSFGTVIANMIATNGHRARLWLRNSALCSAINEQHQNSAYLPGYILNERVEATTSLVAAVGGVDTVFVAVPSQSFRDVVRQLALAVSDETTVISLTKGIEDTGFKVMSEILREELPDNPRGVVSGPNLAREIAAGQVAGAVCASADPLVNSVVYDLLHSPRFLIYSSSDMYGVELGGALKNVYAILAGVGAALKLGENTMGMLLTRSLAEMSRFAVHMGANPMTFLGLAGVGDLFVTCSSPLSRNYRVGLALGEGQPLDEVLATMDQVAEGINTLRLLKTESERREVHMPLVTGLYAMLYEQRPVASVFDDMMQAEQSRDVEFVTS